MPLATNPTLASGSCSLSENYRGAVPSGRTPCTGFMVFRVTERPRLLTGIATALSAQQGLQLGHPCFRGCASCRFLLASYRFLREARLRRFPRLVGFREARSAAASERTPRLAKRLRLFRVLMGVGAALRSGWRRAGRRAGAWCVGGISSGRQAESAGGAVVVGNASEAGRAGGADAEA